MRVQRLERFVQSALRVENADVVSALCGEEPVVCETVRNSYTY